MGKHCILGWMFRMIKNSVTAFPPKPPPGAFDVRFAGDWKYSTDGGEFN
jgi:hypothetical protein